MLFNSIQFLFFFPAVTLLFFLTSGNARVWMLLAAGAVFYMAFIPSYLLILLGTIVVGYLAALGIENGSGGHRKAALAAGLTANLGILLAFKYLDFAMSSLAAASGWAGWDWQWPARNWILPLGLSFHTFQAVSYLIEVYTGRFPAERDFGRYALFILFYPQLVAGPIERPQALLRQFQNWPKPSGDDVVDGLRIMAWGMFKKVVIADRIAPVVDQVFADPASHGGIQATAAALLFLMQIYCDFSGYCDIALGAAKTMGIQLVKNFKAPFNSTSIREFWRRWNVSLAEWLRDYVFFPVGGGGRSIQAALKGTMVVFLVSGIWHGANWTFVAWGLLNGFYCCVETLVSPNARPPKLEGWRLLTRRVFLYLIVAFSMVLFRADSFSTAGQLLARIPTGWNLADARSQLSGIGLYPSALLPLLAGIVLVLAAEGDRLGPKLRSWLEPHAPLRWACYHAIMIAILFNLTGGQSFIYFQF